MRGPVASFFTSMTVAGFMFWTKLRENEKREETTGNPKPKGSSMKKVACEVG